MTDTGFAAAEITPAPPSPWQKTRKWTEAEGAEALKLIAAGKTFGVVAARFGISRNAAIGRVHRMEGWDSTRRIRPKKTPVEKREQAQKAAQKRWGEAGYRPAPLPRPDAPAVRIDAFAEGYQGQTGRVTIHQLTEAHCKFPIDQPAPELVRYCGLDRVQGSPYCQDHYRRVTRTD